MTTTTNKPIQTLRDGSLKAVIWKNTSEKGDFFSVQLVRTYKDERGEYRDGDSFLGADLLRIARLAEKAYDVTAELRRQSRPEESVMSAGVAGRREAARFALASHQWAKGEAVVECETALIDLLADLRHYCDAHGLCFADLDRTAYDHYAIERGEGGAS